MSKHNTTVFADVWVMNTSEVDAEQFTTLFRTAVPEASVPVRQFRKGFSGGPPLNEIANLIYVLAHEHKELALAGAAYIGKKTIDVIADLAKEWATGLHRPAGHRIVIFDSKGNVARAVEMKGGAETGTAASSEPGIVTRFDVQPLSQCPRQRLQRESAHRQVSPTFTVRPAHIFHPNCMLSS